MSGVNQIRQTFLDYFAKNGHETLLSAALWVCVLLVVWGLSRVRTLTLLHRS